jgi:signal peptidase I
MALHMDSWVWKIALVVALIAGREWVRYSSPKEDNGQVAAGARSWIETLDSAALAIGLVFFIIQPFLLQAFYIPSGSMENTLMGPPVQNGPGGDRLLVSKMLYRLRDPHFQEVIVFHAPPPATDNTSTPPGTEFIKRCIGTPGDVVYVEQGKLFRNGRAINEPYTKWSFNAFYDAKIVQGKIYWRQHTQDGAGPWIDAGPEPPGPEMIRPAVSDQEAIEKASPGAVPAGMYLMLGDHRDNSNDSHMWGFVPRANIIGTAICVFWPLSHFGCLDSKSARGGAPTHIATAPVN